MSQPSLERVPWGRTPQGESALFSLRSQGAIANVSDLGAALVGLTLPSADGPVDVVLGLDRPAGASEAPRGDEAYLGAVIGRVANRIAGSRFELAGAPVALTANEGAHHLHGGAGGFHRRLWAAQPIARPDAPALALSYLSVDGEEGYPGRVWATALYRLGPGPVLRLELGALADAVTPVSLTHHPYFNLDGHASGTVRDQRLTLFADRYAVTDGDGIPTGEVREVAGTPFDFRNGKPLGRDLDAPELRGGYDVHLVLRGPPGRLRPAARLVGPATGLELEVWTTQPGIQLYTGNGLDGALRGKGGVAYQRHAGVALEAQAYPNAVNTPAFPSVLLAPGVAYRQVIEYRWRSVQR